MRRAIPIMSLLVFCLLVVSCDAPTEQEAKFLTCLEENDADERVCLEKLGKSAWMPGDDEVCETVARRITAVIEAGGLARYPDLFRNERCARLDKPHNKTAAAASSPGFIDRAFTKCTIDGAYPINACGDIHGRYKEHHRSGGCTALVSFIKNYEGEPLGITWMSLFRSERCRRLGHEFSNPQE